MEKTLVLVALFVFLGFLFAGVIAVKFVARTPKHLRLGSLFLDSYVDSIVFTWLLWMVGKVFRMGWLIWWFDLWWSALFSTFVVALMLIPFNRRFVQYRLGKQGQDG